MEPRDTRPIKLPVGEKSRFSEWGNPWNLQGAYNEEEMVHSDGSSDSSIKADGSACCDFSITLNFLMSSRHSFIRDDGIPMLKLSSKWPSSSTHSCDLQYLAIPRWGPSNPLRDRWRNLWKKPPALVSSSSPFRTTRAHSSKAGLKSFLDTSAPMWQTKMSDSFAKLR